MIFVECPACEEQFGIPPNTLGQQQACPGCRRPFKPQNTVDKLRDQTEESNIGEFSESVSKSMEPPKSKLVKSETVAPPPQNDPVILFDENDDDSELSLAPNPLAPVQSPFLASPEQSLPLSGDQQISTRIKSRQKTTPVIMGLIGITGLVAIFGVLFIAINLLSGSSNSSETATTEREHAAMLQRARNLSEVQAQPEQKTKPIENDKNNDGASTPTLPAPDETPVMFSLNEFESIWDDVNSYLVRLEIKTPYGQREATGFIIDSRGWVATSYLAIKDATEVRISLASRSFDSGSAWREQGDKSKGIIASDPSHDLAIIDANRSLVLNLTEIEFDPDALVVQGQRVICARTPTPGRRLWFTEIRMDRRLKYDELEDDVRSSLTETDSRDPYERWLIHSQPVEDQFRGAPIFNNEGHVVAINCSLKQPGNVEGLALPIEHLLNLKKVATGDVVPFGSSDEPLTDSSEPSTDSPSEISITESDVDEINDLIRSFGTCKEFTFVGRDADEVEQVELFVERMKIVIDMSVDQSLPIEQRDQLSDQANKTMTQTEKVLAGFGGELNRRINDMNHMFLLELDQEKPVPVGLICDVVAGAATSSPFMGKPTITLKPRGSNQLFFATLSDDDIVMPPGKSFMLFGYTDPTNLMTSGNVTSMKLDLLFGSQIRAYGGQ